MTEPAAIDFDVLCVSDVAERRLTELARRFELRIEVLDDAGNITGSFWGEPEAGIAGDCVYVRADTPVHSLLHEFCHILCMTPERRLLLDTDAGSDDAEEAAVCYLQIALAASVAEQGCDRVMQDMDAWGYSFPEGNTRAWFAAAVESRQWLVDKGLLDARGNVTGHKRSV